MPGQVALPALDLAEDFTSEEDGIVDDGLEFGRRPDRFATKPDGGNDAGGDDEDGVLTTLFHE